VRGGSDTWDLSGRRDEMRVAQSTKRVRELSIGRNARERDRRQESIWHAAYAKCRKWSAGTQVIDRKLPRVRKCCGIEPRRHHLFHEIAERGRPERVVHRGGRHVAITVGTVDMLDRGHVLARGKGQT